MRARTADRPEESLGSKKVDLYANFAVSLRSDLMRHRRALTVGDRFEMFLFFRDDHTDGRIFNGRMPYGNVTSRREDIDYACNHVRVEYRLEDRDVMLSFFTDGSMANFRCFQVSLDNGKNWQPKRWPLSDPQSSGRIGTPGLSLELVQPVRIGHEDCGAVPLK